MKHSLLEWNAPSTTTINNNKHSRSTALHTSLRHIITGTYAWHRTRPELRTLYDTSQESQPNFQNYACLHSQILRHFSRRGLVARKRRTRALHPCRLADITSIRVRSIHNRLSIGRLISPRLRLWEKWTDERRQQAAVDHIRSRGISRLLEL